MPEITVFISYSHDSDTHRERVLGLSERLRTDGIVTILDQYVNGSPEGGWPRWMLDQLDVANYVLVICTETYYRRFRGHEQPGKGKGVDWEGALITQEIYDSRSKTLKFVPVFIDAAVDNWIPEPLRSISYYALTSESEYQSLYDLLLGQAGVEPGAIGTMKRKPRATVQPLNFGGSKVDVPVEISRIIKYAPAELIGREAEMKLLNDAWDQAVRNEAKRPHVITFVALGGEGKTSLVAKWAADLAHNDWPGCEAVFAWSFYSQGISESASSDLFLAAALTFFGDAEMAGSAQHASNKGRRLAQLVSEKRALLILDGVEPLQYPPMPPMDGKLKDDGIAALLKGLAANSHGLCVVTTRYSIPDLKAYWNGTVQEEKLLRLSRDAGVSLLKFLDVKGTQSEFEKLVEDVKGHALTLNLLGSYLKRAFMGDIRQRDRVRFEKADARVQGGQAFLAMEAYEKWLLEGGDEGCREVALLRLMGLFDRPANLGCITALRSVSIPGITEALFGLTDEDWELSLTGLEEAKLLTVNRDTAGALISLDAHPLLREYFAKQIREQHPGDWRNAHRHIYKHLIETTNEGDQPTLEELQPLYQAVAHGCQAEMQQEACTKVYRDRILRGTGGSGYYSTKKLGAFGSDLGAIACFFEHPWSLVSSEITESDQSWLLHEVATRLSALGRLTEALEPMRAVMELVRRAAEVTANEKTLMRQLKQIVISASNLSQLELELGEIGRAIEHAELSVYYADRSADAFQRLSKRTIFADALHQVGKRDEANVLFNEAEKMQRQESISLPLLYSLWGFKYCDLLLVPPERAAWRKMLDAELGSQVSELVKVCRDVSERAAQTIEIAERNNWLLDIALDHLALGRAALYEAILTQSDIPNLQYEIEASVDGLRRAGTTNHIPRALLTRAWLRSIEGKRTGSESAQSDLDEAWEIAERGPMPLYMADIHMYRARLLFCETPYPWSNPDGSTRSAKNDLADARRLIEKHGYWRRKEELEDAEAAILGKSRPS